MDKENLEAFLSEIKSGNCFDIGNGTSRGFGDINCLAFLFNKERYIICHTAECDVFSLDKFIEFCGKNQYNYKGKDFPVHGWGGFIHRTNP